MTDSTAPPDAANVVEPPPGARVAAVLRWGIVVALAALALGSLLSFSGLLGSGARAGSWYCPMHPQIVQDRPGDCPICNMALVPKTAATAAASQFYCPMHPQIVQDHEGTCPICHMDLVPKPSTTMTPSPGAEAPASTVPGLVPVTINEQRQQLIGMKTAKAERRTLGSSVRATGIVALDERYVAVVEARFAGFVEELSAMSVGQDVRKGDVVARVFSPELVAAQQELFLAHTAGAGIAGVVDAARQRLTLLGLAIEDIDAIVAAGSVQRTVPLRAPASGVLTKRNVARGAAVQPGMVLFEIADLTRLLVLADVAERDRRGIGPKTRVTVAASSVGGGGNSVVEGVVEALVPVIDPASRTQRARIAVRDHARALAPGSFVDVVLHTGSREGIAVPRDAIVDVGDVQYVFVAVSEGAFAPRRVAVGASDGAVVEIKSGIVEGDVVVTTGNFLIDSESRLQAAIGGAASMPLDAGAANGQ